MLLAQGLTLAAIVLCIAALLRFGFASAVSIFVLVFITFNTPKIFITVFPSWGGGSGLLSQSFEVIPELHLLSGAILISLFLILMLSAYWITSRSREQVQAGRVYRSGRIAALPQWLIIIPLGIALCVLAIASLGVNLAESLSAKRVFVDDYGDTSAGYWLLKAAFLVKAPFYLWLIDERKTRLKGMMALISLIAACLLGFVFSQRTSIFLLAVDYMLYIYMGRRLPIRIMMYMVLGAVIVNAIVLYFRATLSTETFFRMLFFLRYFFDLEKISYIAQYKEYVSGVQYDPSDFISYIHFHVSGITPDISLHHFIGAEIIGATGVGVPPSIIGEVLLYAGAGAIFIAAPMLGMTMGWFENLAARTSSSIVRLLIVMAITRVGYFCANSDFQSLVLRWLLDVSIVVAALIMCRVFRVGGRSREDARASGRLQSSRLHC